MAQDVETAGSHLPQWHGKGVGGVHQGKAGVEGRIVPSGLHLLFLVGDHRAAVALAAGAGHRNYHAQGQGRQVDDAGACPEVLPNVPVIPSCQRYGLAAVHDAAAAYGQNHIGPTFPRQFCALLYLGIGGVGHDAGKLYHGFSGFL